ncbi:L,D-transpeptidase family protein [Enterovibrio nigricans]|uniref:L,D-transpeptidase YcfS n=1 Tax=Enterovibrio nigricans DSM 22720 TaxID=1121868 RepID=A0A1T4VGJ5_9GAMM|nr:L,D-transpeptidase family protein [Enterovibrio nigricans]PKF49249.1 peptidase [Enterovibrio nigricans]SKA64036.1 L,D-transpeptidase YcfS [Enterovibrio nigricans DSM 22720]
MKSKRIAFLTLLLCLSPLSSIANEYTWPKPQTRLLGENSVHIVKDGEHLESIAKLYDVGFLALLSANPGVDPYLPETGTFVTIPQQLILPDVDYEGIVINLAELRLYYFDKKEKKVHVFPIGIGRIGRNTPVMKTKISQKRENPTWTPPESIKKEYLEEKGIVLPDVVPAGPENPLGNRALRLAYGTGSYLIHGTNKSFGIGLRVSSGCIRMRPKDILWLFDKVNVGEKVRVINEPVKTSYEPDGAVFVEVHRPLSNDESDAGTRMLTKPDIRISHWLKSNAMNETRYRAALAVQSGIPIEMGYAAAPEGAAEL